jgi:HEAT repeat protein
MRPDDQVCPCCGADQEALSRKSFTEKLIRALHHPEPETRIRAAFILGKLGAAEAIPALKQILLSPATDPYLAAEAATALGEIGNDEAQQILLSMPTYEYALPVRVAIARAFAVAVKRNGGRRD